MMKMKSNQKTQLLIDNIDKVIELSKDKIKLLNQLKLTIYIKEISEGNTRILVESLKHYLKDFDLSNKYQLPRQEKFAICEGITNSKLSLGGYIKKIPNRVYIIIGNNNKNNRVIMNLEHEKDKFEVKI